MDDSEGELSSTPESSLEGRFLLLVIVAVALALMIVFIFALRCCVVEDCGVDGRRGAKGSFQATVEPAFERRTALFRRRTGNFGRKRGEEEHWMHP